MTPPSYVGEETVAVCPEGHKINVPDDPQFWERPEEEQTRGYCEDCGTGQWFDVWGGPVVAI